jgi:hypothetical protein
MDQDHILQSLRLLAVIFCFFVFSVWGGCTSSDYLNLQTHKSTVGQLDDIVAQRLYAVSQSIKSIDYGNNAESYAKTSVARQQVLLAIIGGSTLGEALEEVGVEPEGVVSTNAAVEAVMALAE